MSPGGSFAERTTGAPSFTDTEMCASGTSVARNTSRGKTAPGIHLVSNRGPSMPSRGGDAVGGVTPTHASSNGAVRSIAIFVRDANGSGADTRHAQTTG